MPDQDLAEWMYLVEERAAIKEFDGGMSREQAEMEAVEEVEAMTTKQRERTTV